MAIGPAESAVATLSQPGEEALPRFASVRLPRPVGVKLEYVAFWPPVTVVRKLKKPIAQAEAEGLLTLGVVTVVVPEVSSAPPEARIGLVAFTPRHAPVSKIAFVFVVHVTVGAVSLLPATL